MLEPVGATGVLAALTFNAAVAFAAPMLDQSYVLPPSTTSISWRQLDTTWDEAQTFTASLGGELRRIDVGIVRGINALLGVTIDIRQTSSNRPVDADAPVLASVSLAAADVPVDTVNLPQPYTVPLTSIDLTGFHVPISPGQLLAITMRTDEPDEIISNERGYLWRISAQGAGTYAGGSAFTRTTGSWTTAGPTQDFVFQSFVEIPEPAATALILAATAAALTGRFGRSRSV
jgi:hypothetical protein